MDSSDRNTPVNAESTRTAAAGQEAKLVFQSGPCRGKVVPLRESRTRIGRSSRNDVVIDLGQVVSSFHAAIYRETAPEVAGSADLAAPGGPGTPAPAGGVPGETWWIEDLGSKNGTYLNGEPVRRARLREGDTICFARTGPEARFTTGEPELSGIFETTLTTFRRTGSLPLALRELLPGRSSRKVVHLSGVERLLDDRLEKMARRSRWVLLASVASVLAAAAVVLSIIVIVPGGGLREVEPPEQVVALEPTIQPIYSSLFFSSREHAIGTVRVINHGDKPLEGARLTFGFLREARDYLVQPFEAEIPPVEPGGKRDVDLKPLFSETIRSPRGREVTALVRLLDGDRVVKERALAVYVHGHNVFNWEEPRRVAAFINPRDPAVTQFTRSVWRQMPEEGYQGFPPPRFRRAVSLLAGLAHLRLRYMPDPATPASSKVDTTVSDLIHHPWETILGGTGDCDDLSVLCAAVLESVDIPAAIVVGSTHVLLMFDSGVDAASLESTPLDPETVVPWNGRIWIPVETTVLGRSGASFSSLWSAAWPRRAAILSPDMTVVEVRGAWQAFPPAHPDLDEETLKEISHAVRLDADVGERIEADLEALKKLFLENLEERVREIEEEEQAGPGRDRSVGLLLARSGLFERARARFHAAILGEGAAPPSGPAELERALAGLPAREEIPYLLFDLGICATLAARFPEDFRRAARYYRAGLERLPGSDDLPERGEALLRLALTHRLGGDLAAERSVTAEAFRTFPLLRETYRRMVTGAGARAAAPGAADSDDELRRFLLAGLR